MSISVSDELQLFAQEIQSFLSPNILQDLARDVGFVQRTSKYQAKDLVALCVWMSQNVATTSLTQVRVSDEELEKRITYIFWISSFHRSPINSYISLNSSFVSSIELSTKSISPYFASSSAPFGSSTRFPKKSDVLFPHFFKWIKNGVFCCSRASSLKGFPYLIKLIKILVSLLIHFMECFRSFL
ncbi:hypothetical protein SAMN04488574_102206 [Bacillus sp. 71mf]|nr:hypothetical protein SAMN04488574_102206 [Bacillus sp. 71mf]SFS39704.1 hypothetical protein SAMN04488145_101260 [Bacillus sp. 103mf]